MIHMAPDDGLLAMSVTLINTTFHSFMKEWMGPHHHQLCPCALGHREILLSTLSVCMGSPPQLFLPSLSPHLGLSQTGVHVSL